MLTVHGGVLPQTPLRYPFCSQYTGVSCHKHLSGTHLLTVHGGVLQQTPLRYPFAHSTRGCPATNTSQVPICSQCTGVSCNKHLSGTHLLTVHGGVLPQTPLRYPFAHSARGCPATNTSQVPICSQYTGVSCHKHLSGTHLLTVHGGVLPQTPLRYPFAHSARGCPATNTSQVPICSQYTGVSCNKHLSGTHLLTVHGGVLPQTPLRYPFAHSTRGCPATNTSQVPICSQCTGVSCHKHLSGTHLLTVHGGVLQQTPLRYPFAHSTRGCPATNTSQVPICSQCTGVSCNKHLSGTHLLTVHGGALPQTPLRYPFAHSARGCPATNTSQVPIC